MFLFSRLLNLNVIFFLTLGNNLISKKVLNLEGLSLDFEFGLRFVVHKYFFIIFLERKAILFLFNGQYLEGFFVMG